MKLTKKDVLYIFSQRAQVNAYESNAVTSRTLASQFGISERTVRDIWSRRSRRHLTQSAWTVEEVVSEIKRKRIGRPPGVKDAAPRQRQKQGESDGKGSVQTCASETTSNDGATGKQGGSRSSGSAQESSETTSDDGAPDTSGTSEDKSEENGGASSSGRNSNPGQNENGGSSASQSSPEPGSSSCGLCVGQQNSQKEQILNHAALSQLNQDWQHFVSSRLANTQPIQMHNKLAFGVHNSSNFPLHFPRLQPREDQQPSSHQAMGLGLGSIGQGLAFPSQFFQGSGFNVPPYNQQPATSNCDTYFKNATLSPAQSACTSTVKSEPNAVHFPPAQCWVGTGLSTCQHNQVYGAVFRPQEAGALGVMLPRQLDPQAAALQMSNQRPPHIGLPSPHLEQRFPFPPSQLHVSSGFSLPGGR